MEHNRREPNTQRKALEGLAESTPTCISRRQGDVAATTGDRNRLQAKLKGWEEGDAHLWDVLGLGVHFRVVGKLVLRLRYGCVCVCYNVDGCSPSMEWFEPLGFPDGT